MSFISYSVDSNGCHKRNFVSSLPNNGSIVYDDPVDRSSFRPDSEQVRLFHMTGQGSTGNPVYDDKELPTDLEVKIRSGKLDKAEISQLQQQKKEEVKEAADSAKKEKKQKELESVNNARQEYLDKATGFKGSEQNVTS